MVKELSKNLLGLPAITALNLAVRVDAVKEDDDIWEKFAPVFRGLGNMGEEYQIKLKPDPQPRELPKLHIVPLPPLKKCLKCWKSSETHFPAFGGANWGMPDF